MKTNYVAGVYLRVNADRTAYEWLCIYRENGLHEYKIKSAAANRLIQRFFHDSPYWLVKRIGPESYRLTSSEFGVYYLPDWVHDDDEAIQWCQVNGLTHTRLYQRLIAGGK